MKRSLRSFGATVWGAVAILLATGCSHQGDGNGSVHNSLPVSFESAALFVGSYAEVGVEIKPDSGIDFDELEFEVDSKHGKVSLSRGPGFDPAQPTIILIAASEPGVHEIRAIRASTGALVGKGRFEVFGGLWPDDGQGPPIVFENKADFDASLVTAPGVLGIFEGSPMTGTRKVLVVHVDTATRRYPHDLDPNVWGEIFDSRKGPSVRKYIEEVSHGQLNLDVRVEPFVVGLPEQFEAYFVKSERDDQGWFAKESFYQAFASLAQGKIEFKWDDDSWVDDLVFVALDPDPWAEDENGISMQGDRYVHPNFAGKPVYSIDDENLNISTLFVTYDRRDREPVDLGVHEYGHALGLPDMHFAWSGSTPGNSRILGRHYEPMSGVGPYLPHFSMYSKIRLGWVPERSIKVFGAEKEDGVGAVAIMRTSLATAKPEEWFPDTHPAAAFLLAPGLVYLWEHRNTPEEFLPEGIADRNLPVEPVVLGTEHNRSERSPILTLDRSKGDGHLLTQPGQKYLEVDGGDLDNRRSIQVTLVDVNRGVADLFVVLGESLRPEPHIRPWEEAGRQAYRSEDVLVRNARNWDGQAWTDEDAKWDALIDGENRIVARVRNDGRTDAPGVKVVFRYAEWGAGQADPHWVTVSTESVDIPARGVVEVVSEPWILRSEDGVSDTSHYCIQAVITGDEDDLDAPYSVPGSDPPLMEVNPGNNRAQSNVSLVYSSIASPSTRVEQVFRVYNPFGEDRVFRLEVQQNNPLFRTYVGHRWVVVPAEGYRDVPVLAEYSEDGSDPGLIDAYRDVPNYVHIRAVTLQGEDDLRPVGGATLVVRRGDRTQIVEFAAIPDGGEVLIRGRVRDVRSGLPAPDGTVVVSLMGDDVDPIAERVPTKQGVFELRAPSKGWERARALYVPPPGHAESRSGQVDNPYAP